MPRFERKRKRGGNPQFQHPPIVPEHLAVPRPVFWRPGFGAGVDGADMEASPRIVSDALFELTYVRTCAQCRHRICSRTAGNILLPLLAFLRMNAPRGRFDWPHSTCRGLNVCPTGSRSFVLPPRPELGPPPPRGERVWEAGWFYVLFIAPDAMVAVAAANPSMDTPQSALRSPAAGLRHTHRSVSM